MKKLNTKDFALISILFVAVMGFVLYLRARGFIFGSNVDWISQHITIPEYFRSLFYQNGTILPLFNMELGMGQNIYYFAYYGLLSPLILPSYLFPFMEMSTYIQILSVLTFLTSIFLLYLWIRDKFNTNVAFTSALIFTLASPMLFHSHRHIMFVNYMPFLLLALICVDRYFKNRNRAPLIFCTFLMIMTSYFFSVSGIIVIGIYALYKVFRHKKIKWVTLKPVTRIVFFVTVGILMSGIIIIPTLYALLSGRVDTTVTLSFSELFMPRLNYPLTFYTAYGMGLSFIYVVSLVYAFMLKKKESFFLAGILVLCMTLPLINYILNGFMYIDGKTFIPFIPLAILIIAQFLNDLFRNKIDLKKLIIFLIPVIILMLYFAITYNNLPALIIDMMICMSVLLLIKLFKKPYLIFLTILIISPYMTLRTSLRDSFVTTTAIAEYNNPAYKELFEFVANDFYRTGITTNTLDQVNRLYGRNHFSTTIYSSASNNDYLNFHREIFQNEIPHENYPNVTQVNNLLFNIFTGTRYLITDKPLLGYEYITTINNRSLYENPNVMPFAYATNQIMSLREFNTLEYPYTVDALLRYTVVNLELENVYRPLVREIDLEMIINDIDGNVTYEVEDDRIYIEAGKQAFLNIDIGNNLKNKILIISFNMDKEKQGYWCRSQITINGINNALSCSNWKYHNLNYDFNYVLAPSETLTNLDVRFSADDFILSNLKFYTIDYDSLKDINRNIDQLIIDHNKSNHRRIVGEIDVKNDGYFKFSIPWERNGFTIRVDGEKVKPVRVDTTFIGFEIPEGVHTVEIEYTPPFFWVGVLVSFIGVILFILTRFYSRLSKPIDNSIEASKKTMFYLYKLTKDNFIRHKSFIFLFLSLFMLDLMLRVFYFNSVNFYGIFRIVPNLFSILWISTIILIAKLFTNRIGKTIYLTFYIFSLIMFIVHAVYFSYFQHYFDFHVITMAGEGATYLDTILLNIQWWVVVGSIISVYLTIKGLRILKHDPKINIFMIIIVSLSFIAINLTMPLLLGQKDDSVEWDDWRNPRKIYDAFNDNNKSMMVTGLFEYNFRNFYVTFLKNSKELTAAELALLEDNFSNAQHNLPNRFTGIFEGKNLILVQLESIDTFLLTEKIMPVTYKMMRNSINFTNHFSFAPPGATFNSEFMINIGYSSAYNYNQNAYAFSRNNYDFSLPNLFRELGYTANAFHMNTSEYYSRAVNYRAFGYQNYFGLRDQSIYHNREYWLDRELIENEIFYNNIFQEPSLSYIITYTAHMPFRTARGTCPMLTDQVGLSEFECASIQAGETDNFMALLLKGLEDNDMLDNTVIVAFADHYLYTFEDKSLPERLGKDTRGNLINHTPFFIWSNGLEKRSIRHVTSQLDILPTILNLFGVEHFPNYYLGNDALDPDFNPLVFFPDGSWWNGNTYVANGEYQFGSRMSLERIYRINTMVRRKMILNDAVIKSDYFRQLPRD